MKILIFIDRPSFQPIARLAVQALRRLAFEVPIYVVHTLPSKADDEILDRTHLAGNYQMPEDLDAIVSLIVKDE